MTLNPSRWPTPGQLYLNRAICHYHGKKRKQAHDDVVTAAGLLEKETPVVPGHVATATALQEATHGGGGTMGGMPMGMRGIGRGMPAMAMPGMGGLRPSQLKHVEVRKGSEPAVTAAIKPSELLHHVSQKSDRGRSVSPAPKAVEKEKNLEKEIDGESEKDQDQEPQAEAEKAKEAKKDVMVKVKPLPRPVISPDSEEKEKEKERVRKPLPRPTATSPDLVSASEQEKDRDSEVEGKKSVVVLEKKESTRKALPQVPPRTKSGLSQSDVTSPTSEAETPSESSSQQFFTPTEGEAVSVKERLAALRRKESGDSIHPSSSSHTPKVGMDKDKDKVTAESVAVVEEKERESERKEEAPPNGSAPVETTAPVVEEVISIKERIRRMKLEEDAAGAAPIKVMPPRSRTTDH